VTTVARWRATARSGIELTAVFSDVAASASEPSVLGLLALAVT